MMQVKGFLLRAAATAMCLLVTACTTSRAPEPAGADVRIERVDKAFAIPQDVSRISIDNRWGEINVRGNDEREVGVHAVVQRMAPHFAQASFRTHRDGGTLRIDVGFDKVRSSGAAARTGRIDIAVYIPTAMALSLRTSRDRIAAKNRAGSIEATTDTGDILASSRDRLQLHTDSGQIRAVALGARWNGPSDFSTESGRIILLVPTFGDVVLSADTSGRLSTNFGLSVHREAGHNWARARYGQGISVLHAHSTSGEIVLEQLVLVGDHNAIPQDDD